MVHGNVSSVPHKATTNKDTAIAYVWCCAAHPLSLAGLMGHSVLFSGNFMHFCSSVLVKCCCWSASPGAYIFHNVMPFQHDDITNEIIICMGSWSYDLLGIKGAAQRGGSVTETFQGTDCSKYTLVAMHLGLPCDQSLLSSTVKSVFVVCYPQYLF